MANPTVPRHTLLVRLEHWTIALSGLFLFFTGFGQFPMFQRYNVDKLPGLAWSSTYTLEYRLHLWGAVLFTMAVAFHLMHHILRREMSICPRRGDLGESWRISRAMLTGRPEPPSGKFLAEQRLAYVVFGGSMVLLIVTGLLKAWKNLPGVYVTPGTLTWLTMLHNLGTVVFLISFLAHVGALLIKPNRPLFWSMFSGRVDAAYARHRHPLWDPETCTESKPQGEPAVEEDGGHGPNYVGACS